LSGTDIADLCASFQAAIVDLIVDRTRAGLGAFRKIAGRANALVAAGGVASNGAIRRALGRFSAESGLNLVIPPLILCTDNGAMIAWAGVERLCLGQADDLTVAARPRWPLDTRGTPVVHGKA
jgi:N6-L-threonylcarbamoyladenine synthase